MPCSVGNEIKFTFISMQKSILDLFKLLKQTWTPSHQDIFNDRRSLQQPIRSSDMT